MLPEGARGEGDQGRKTFPKGRWRQHDEESPPINEAIVRPRDRDRNLAPGKNFMPDLSGERASNPEVRHGLGCLIAADTETWMLKAVASEVVHRPAPL